MLRDRSAMAKYITKNDIIWKWTVRKFAGEDLPDSIGWNNKKPYHNAPAVRVYPTKPERSFIRIKNVLNVSFDTMRARTIFELHNISLYQF